MFDGCRILLEMNGRMLWMYRKNILIYGFLYDMDSPAPLALLQSSQVHIIVQLAEAQGHARQLWDSFRATGEESVLLLEEEEARSVSATAFGNATRAALVMLRTESNMPLHVVVGVLPPSPLSPQFLKRVNVMHT
jgi:hypothetical protein